MIDKVMGACLGTAIGDALGMPAECKSPETIAKLYKKITGYRTPKRLKHDEYGHTFEKGAWTDDTQLMLALGESIVEHRGISLYGIASNHVKELNKTTSGWGRTTIKAIERIVAGAEWHTAGVPNGAGNGPPMKIAPIGVLYGLSAINEYELISVVNNISLMTHGDPRPAIAAILQCKLIGNGLAGGETGLINYMRKLPREAKNLEQSFGEENPSIAVAIAKAMSITHRVSDNYLRKTIGTGSFVVESFPFMCAMVFKYHRNPEKCLEKIVNLGGDADTNAAMAGAILGATYKYSCFPSRWRRGLKQKSRIVEMAKGLIRVANIMHPIE